jgi:hypothetical protein
MNQNRQMLVPFKLIIILITVYLFISCNSKNNSNTIKSSAKVDSTSFEYFLNQVQKKEIIPSILNKKFFPSSFFNKEIIGKEVTGNSVFTSKNHYLVSFQSGKNSPCLIQYVTTFNKKGKMLSYIKGVTCDCNELFCKNESIRIASSKSLIHTIEKIKKIEDENNEDPEVIITEKIKNTMHINEKGNFSLLTSDTLKTFKIKEERYIHHFICYKNDNSGKQIWIGFKENETAIQVKYEGMKAAIDLVPILNIQNEKTNALTEDIQWYYEVYNGKVNGTYKLTHAGIWDYVEYTRGKDEKKYNYTIIHEANPYGTTPCF